MAHCKGEGKLRRMNKRALGSHPFCWQDPINCASVGTKNLGDSGVRTRNTQNTIVVLKITIYGHFCCMNHKVCTFVSKITKYALLSQKSQHTHSFVAKITTYAHFGRERKTLPEAQRTQGIEFIT